MAVYLEFPRAHCSHHVRQGRRMGLVFFVLVAAAGMSAAGLGTDRVVLGLKWRHQFQFAGYYAAQAKGYYAEEGMEVRIEEGRPGQSSIETVLQGEAQFGVSDSDIVLARLQGRPLVVCAAVFQHSPSVILSRRDRNIRKPSDLAGARVMMPDMQGSAQLHAMLAREGIPAEAVHIVPHTWRLADLIEGRVDAVSAYATVEPAQLRGLGIESAGLHAIDYGVDFYGDMLFTTEREARAHPERAAAFTRASMKGWDYALRNPEEIADLILKFESVRLRGVTRKNLLDEAAAMKAFILPDLVEIGHLNPGRLQQIARTFTELKMAPRGRSLEGFLLAPRIHDPLPMRRLLQAGSVMALGVLLVFLWNLQIRRRVNRRTRELKEEVRLRTLAEAGLRASEERFRMMFTGAATGIAVMDPGGRFLQANPAYCATTGYSESELQGMTISDLLPGEDLAAYRGNLEALLAGKSEHFVRESRCLKKGGGCAWKRASVSVVRTADGRPGSIILVAEDISARREAEEAASGNAELLHMAGRIGGIGAWSVEFPGARVIWSEEVYRIHELDTGAPPGMEAALDFFRPDSRRLLESAVQKGEPCDLELELVTARGNPRWVRATSKVERTTDGRLRRFYGIFQDITGRKHAAEKLKASEAQYRLLFTHNPLPMWVCEGDTLRFLAVNAAASLHYGYSEAEFLGMTLGDLRVGDATGDGQRHRTRNGTLIDVETSSDGIIFDGRPAFLTMAHDVTELARVYRAQRMLSACNEALIRAEAEDGLLHEICRIAVEIGGYRMAWVGFAREDEARTISPVAHAGAEDGYLSEIRLSWRD
ncbi:MAG TPA: ABC transporter substrate-binding protein, partial [Rariglobus sp.]